MPMLTIRIVPDEVHHALRAWASSRGRSIEAEVRAILKETVLPEIRVALGTLLTAIGQHSRLTEEEFASFLHRDKSVVPPIDLE